jgi:hypothetical protein
VDRGRREHRLVALAGKLQCPDSTGRRNSV